MSAILVNFATLAPIFALVLLGFATAKAGLISQSASSGLSAFVNSLAIPALMFRTVVEAKPPDVNPFPYWASYFIALGIVWFLADRIAHRLGRRGGRRP